MDIIPKVSVIVPVFNREKCLRQCVDSICAQTLHAIEIILVDDGSTDGSPTICDEYAVNDSRVHVIHKQNAGMGVAYNTGIAAARGEYIGFVETDDWIEPEMYERLYDKAVEQDVDVVKSLYTEMRNGKGKQMCKFNMLRDCYKRKTNPLDTADLCYGHISHWSAIYRRAFIESKGIEFPVTPGASAQDIGFNWQVYVNMQSYYILPECFYNYRFDETDQSLGQGWDTALKVLNAHRAVFDWSIKKGISHKYLEVSGKAMFLLIPFNLNVRCRGINKIRYILRISKYLRDYFPLIALKRLAPALKSDFVCVAFHPIFFLFKRWLFKHEKKPNIDRVRIMGVKVFERKKESNKCSRRILGIPYVSSESCGNKTIKRFLGIRYNTIITKPPQDSQDVHLLQIITHANAITNTHRETFLKYKNCHAGEDVVLVATGPTLNYFVPLDDCVYVGVNKAVSYSKVHFDYLFFQDFINHHAREILNLIRDYKGAKKFYGITQEIIRRDWIVPESAAIRDGAERYYVISQWKYPPVHYPYDIASEPFGDSASVSFSAAQFILWTNPRRVYLVGADCSSDYFDKSVSHINSSIISKQLQGWRVFKEFADSYYPNTEIITINPVGLKGIFRDMYTRSYLKKNPRIKIGEKDVINKI